MRKKKKKTKSRKKLKKTKSRKKSKRIKKEKKHKETVTKYQETVYFDKMTDVSGSVYVNPEGEVEENDN